MKEKIKKALLIIGHGLLEMIAIVFCVWALFCVYDCSRTKPIIGKEKVVKQTQTIKKDTVLVRDTVMVYSKPKTIIKWKSNSPEFDGIKINYCDSTNIQTDTITKQGVKVAILDTIRNNSVVGRQTQIISANQVITNTIRDSIFTLRVDTVYIKPKRFLLCAACFGAGFVIGTFSK